MYLNVWLKDTASFLLLSRNSFWTNSAFCEYKNKSANKGAPVIPICVSRLVSLWYISHFIINNCVVVLIILTSQVQIQLWYVGAGQYKTRSIVAEGVARKRTLTAKSQEC
jgi:hypothetical protein